MMFYHMPGSLKNEVVNSVNWDTVVFYNDPLTGNVQMAEQKMLAPPKTPHGVEMGGLLGGKTSSVDCNLDKIMAKGVPPLTYAEVKKIFALSVEKKIGLGAAAIEIKGKDMFMPKVYDRFMSKDSSLAYAWYEGCKTQNTNAEAPVSGKVAAQARRRLIPNENGFAPASA